MSVYDALQRARYGSGFSLPFRPATRPHAEPERAAIPFAANPIAAALGPLLAAVRPMLDGNTGVVLQFVAATAGEGASTVAREFAVLASTTGNRRTLLLDGDRANPSIAMEYGCASAYGLTDALSGEVDDEDVLRTVPGTQLSVARLFGDRGAPATDAETLREIYRGLRDHFDLIVVDCPPVSSEGFAELLPNAADGLVLVIEAERTRPVVISHAKSLVQQAGGSLIGAVLNKRTNYIPDFLYRLL